MKHLFQYVLLILLLASCNSSSQNYDLALKDVTIFNSKTKALEENKTILIKADTIASIVDSNQSYKANKVIEGKNRLVTPGFIDTHTHIGVNYGANIDYANYDLKTVNLEMIRRLMSYQYLTEGVTTIIDMGQPENWMDISLNWQNNPTPNYPNMYICGGSIVSDEDRWQPAHHIEVKNPEDGRQKVRDYAAKGLKHMKLYRKLKKPDYKAMVDEAKKHDIIINTHVDNNVVTISEAMDFGVLNFEHFFTTIPSVLNYDHHWKKMNKKYGIKMSGDIDEFTAHMVYFFKYINDNPDIEDKLEKLFDRMAKEGANISTAINVLASAPQKTDFFTSFEYFPIRNAPNTSYNANQKEILNQAFEMMMSYVKMAHDKGVKLRIGTDCRFGGKSLLHELILFAKAGISIEDALQIATINGYEAMKIDDKFGSIEAGKKADLVVFDKNPFDDYNNFLSGKTIIKDGQILNLKKSVSHDLEKAMVFEGVAAGKKLFNRAINDSNYEKVDDKELENVFLELLATGKTDETIATYNLFLEFFPNKSIKIEDNTLVNAVYALLRENEVDKAISFSEFAGAQFPEALKTLAQKTLITMLKTNINNGIEYFKAHNNDSKYRLDEAEMNGVGYLLIELNRLEESLTIFKLNVESFPESWNVYDSLGEAYTLLREKKLAIENYEKSISLNPKNEVGIKVLNKLKQY